LDFEPKRLLRRAAALLPVLGISHKFISVFTSQRQPIG
jgi:hypothetical protein